MTRPDNEAFQRRFETTMTQRFSRLSPERQEAAWELLGHFIGRLADAEVAAGVQSDLAFRIFQRPLRNIREFGSILDSYSADLEARQVTMGGHPIFKSRPDPRS